MRLKIAAGLGLFLIALAGASYAPYDSLATIFPDVAAQGAKPKQAPIFEVDPFWPKPLPNHWVMGSTIGLSVDAQDHVWVIHRPRVCRGQLQGRRY